MHQALSREENARKMSVEKSTTRHGFTTEKRTAKLSAHPQPYFRAQVIMQAAMVRNGWTILSKTATVVSKIPTELAKPTL